MLRFKPLNFLFYLSVLSLSFGQFALISRGGGAPIYIFDLVVGIYAVVGVFFLLGSKRKFSFSNPHLAFLAFTVIAALSLIPRLTTLPQNELLISAFYLIRWIIYLISAVITFNLYKAGELKLNSILSAFLISALFISLAGFVQLVILPDFSVLDKALGWDPHKNRLASVFFDPNFTGGYLALVLGVFLSLHFYKLRRLTKLEIFMFLPLILVALFLTFSRSSWGMFAVGVLVIGLFRARWLVLVALLLAFSAYFAVPRVQTRLSGVTDPADSAAFRLVSWKNTLDIAKDKYLMGVGFNSFRFAQEDYGYIEPGTTGGNSASGSDSSLLLILATTGALGLGIFLIGFLGSTQSAFLWPLILGLLLHSQFVNSLFYPQMLFLWLLFWGLAPLLVFDKD